MLSPGKYNMMQRIYYEKSRLIYLLATLILVSFLAGCISDENEAFIQGTWFYNDPHIQEQVGESFSETTWIFDGGNYEVYTCCFVESHQYGRYTILESDEDSLLLELFNTNGKFNSERFQVNVLIDRESDTIRVLRAGPFTRISTTSNP
jgi:hypothetical protein